jgi:RHS repeat-associated protein
MRNSAAMLALRTLLRITLVAITAAACLLPARAEAARTRAANSRTDRALSDSAERSLGHAQRRRREHGLEGLGRAQRSEHGRLHPDARRGSSIRIWDGNVPLHEWVERAPDAVDETFTSPEREDDVVAAGEKALKAMLAGRPANGPPTHADTYILDAQKRASADGTADTPVTWLFEPESFAPLAKLVGGETYGIVTDHLGTPRAMFDAAGHEVWAADIDAYGDLRNVRGERAACPFRWPGQYEDSETGLYYNRWRYYNPRIGTFVSQDPIRTIAGLRLTSYVHDPLTSVDMLGLAFYRGARPGESPSFTARSNDFKVDPDTGLTRTTHGVSVFDNPESVSSKGFVPHEVDESSLGEALKIERRGKDPAHFEIMPKEPMTPKEYQSALSEIRIQPSTCG